MNAERKDTPADLDGFREAMREAGIEEIVDQTLRVFLTEAPSHYEYLSQTLSGTDTDEIAKAAHGFKSASSAIYAHELTDLLRRTEMMGKEGNATGAKGLFDNISEAYDGLVTYLKTQTSDD